MVAVRTEFAADSPLEGDGFEPLVPRLKDLCKRSPPIASTGGQIGRKNDENADLAPSLRHPKFAERVEGFRDTAGRQVPNRPAVPRSKTPLRVQTKAVAAIAAAFIRRVLAKSPITLRFAVSLTSATIGSARPGLKSLG
jgi:hypothetical protein